MISRMALPESPSPILHAEYVKNILNSREKPVEVRANFSRLMLARKGIDAEGFKKLLQGVKVPLALDFDFMKDGDLIRAILDLQEKLQFPQLDNPEGQDGIFGQNTFDAVEGVRKAEEVAKARRDTLRSQIGSGEKLVLEPGVQPGLAEALKGVKGERWVGRLSGNGSREVAIFIPQGADPNKPFEVIYHFHGVNGHSIGQDPESTGRNRLEQVLKAAARTGSEGRNIVVVYPLSAGHRPGKGGKLPGLTYDADWMRPNNASGDDMNQMHAEVLQRIESQFGHKINVGSITAKGHSAGGTPLVNLAEAGFKVNRIDFLDASYGLRIPRCYRAAIKNNPDLELNIFLKPQTQTDNVSTRSVEGKPGVRIIEARIAHGRMNETYFGWQRP